MAVPRSAFVRITVPVRDAAQGERVAAEAYAAGAGGLEEGEADARIVLWIYAPAAQAEAVRRAVAGIVGGAPPHVEVVPDRDWAAAWRVGHVPVAVSARLMIRPSFRPAALAPGQRELVIDPGQAFGTGTHESTRLALEWLDRKVDELAPGSRLLDVGTGTGILALAVLRLAATPVHVVGCDLDPLAIEAARGNARANGVPGLDLFTGGLDAIAARPRFHGIVANLLRRELEPLLAGIAERLLPEGFAVFAGLLEADRAEVEALARKAGLAAEGVRARDDASGARWIGLLMRRAPGSASGPSGARGSSGREPAGSSP
jgi:ribosomal protein L11 methyltransferase